MHSTGYFLIARFVAQASATVTIWGSARSTAYSQARDQQGNNASGDVFLRDVTGSLVKATSRKVVVAGLDDVVVVETPEAVLVIPLERSQEVREIHREADPG